MPETTMLNADDREHPGKCPYCNAHFTWKKGQAFCCADCAPRQEREKKEMAEFVVRDKLKMAAKAKEVL